MGGPEFSSLGFSKAGVAELSTVGIVLVGVNSTISDTAGADVSLMKTAVGADVDGMSGKGLLVGGRVWVGKGVAVFEVCNSGVGVRRVAVAGRNVGFRVLVGLF